MTRLSSHGTGPKIFTFGFVKTLVLNQILKNCPAVRLFRLCPFPAQIFSFPTPPLGPRGGGLSIHLFCLRAGGTPRVCDTARLLPGGALVLSPPCPYLNPDESG